MTRDKKITPTPEPAEPSNLELTQSSCVKDNSINQSEMAVRVLPNQEIDAVRRHICHILGFDYGMIDIVHNGRITNVITFSADTTEGVGISGESHREYSIEELEDQNAQSLSIPDSLLSQQVRQRAEPWVGQVFIRRKPPFEDKASDEGNSQQGFLYVIVPILEGNDEKNRVLRGLIRVVSFDNSRDIEGTDISTLKLIGQHLATRMPQLAHVESAPNLQEISNKPVEVEPLLLAHSNRVIRRRLSRSLSGRYNVLEVDDAPKALELLKQSSAELLIIDCEIKDPSGYSLCHVIKQSTQWKYLPVILVTSESNPGGKIEGLNAGADDCITDSCTEAELLARVRSLLRLRKTERELSTQLQLLEDYAQRLEHHTEEERLASRKLSRQNEQLDQMNRKLEHSKREIEIRRNQDLLLHRISDIIRKSFNIDANVEEMLESLAGWLELDCCFVVLPSDDEPQDTIRREYVTESAYKVVEKDLDLAILEIFKSHFTEDRILLVNDIKRDKHVAPFRQKVLSCYHMYSLFYVPITYEQKLLGILGGHKAESEAQWTSDNESFLRQVADQLAIGVTNARLYKRVERQAISDGLTGLFNHRTGQERLTEQIRIAERYQRNLSVVMIDIDHFKSINDTYGHPVGDTVLKAIAHVIRRDCRDVDIPIRYGGEEFLIILPEINQEGAVVVAERLRTTLCREKICHDNLELSVTASLGIASYPEDATTQHHLLELVDKALYMSKRLGRNQIHTASDLMFNEFQSDKGLQPEKNKANLDNEQDKEVFVSEVVEMVKALAGALYAKSEYNKVHHLETARFAEMVAKMLGSTPQQIEQIRVAGLLHDVGLLSVPEDILNKQGQVTGEELKILMQHPTLGAQMFRPVQALKEICDILESHHECWDGTGYPRGLKGEEIPLPARIVAIVDAYHAMISDRPYRPAMSSEKAKKVLRNGAGSQFDPFLIDIFLAVLSEAEGKSA